MSRKMKTARQRGLHVEPLERREMLSVDPNWLNAFEGAVGVHDVIVAPNGDAVVTGSFGDAFDFELGPGATVLTPTSSERWDGFVARYASADGALVWAKQFSSDTDIQPNSLAVDDAGNVLLAAQFRGTVDFDVDGASDATSVSGNDTLIARFDSVGVASLVSHIGGDGEDVEAQLVVDSFGNIYVLGESNSTTLALGSQMLVRNGSSMGYLAQLDASGAVQWARQLDGQTSADEVTAQALTVGPDGSPVVAARYSGTADLGLDGSGQAVVETQVNPNDTHDGIVARYDSLGNLDWAYAVDAAIKDLAVDASLYIYGSGNFRHTDDFDPRNTHPGDADILTSIDGSRDAMVMKLDASGAFQQVVAFGGAGEDGASGQIALDGAGRVFASGPFAGQAAFGGQSLAAAGIEDAFVVELDANLAVQNALRLGNASAREMELDAVGNLLFVGRYNDGADLPTGEILSGSSDYLYKLDPDVRTITGRVFADLDGDGVDDDSNRAIGDDLTVYLDTNENGQRDAGEAFTTTIASGGAFSFPNVAPGTYTVAQELPAGWTQTTPADAGGLPVNPVVTVSPLAPSPSVTFGVTAPTSTTTFVSADTPVAIKNGANTSQLVVNDGSHNRIFDVNVQVNFPDVAGVDNYKRIELYLVSPSGTRVRLVDKTFQSGAMEFSNTVFDDEAHTSIWDGSKPFSGSYRPIQSLDAFDAEDASGAWTLEVAMVKTGKPDTLESWSLDIMRFATPQPPQAPTIASLTAAPSPVVQGDDLTVTANGVNDADGAVSSVAFYRDANGNGQLDVATDVLVGNDVNGSDGWSVTTPTGTLALGGHTYFAHATDDDGMTSNVASTVSEVIDQPVGSFDDIYVSFIDMQTRNRGKNLDGRIVVSVMNDLDGDGTVAGDAGAANVWVEAVVTGPGGFVTTVSGFTDAAGEFRSDWLRGISAGDYTVDVLDLVHATFDWNMVLNLEDDSDGDGWPDDMFTF